MTFAFASVPRARALIPSAVVLVPIDVEFSPPTTDLCPITMTFCPVAVLSKPLLRMGPSAALTAAIFSPTINAVIALNLKFFICPRLIFFFNYINCM